MIKGGMDLSGLREIRTIQSSTRRKPTSRVQNTVYLDLYMLCKEKDRLEKELYLMNKRKESIEKRLRDIYDEMSLLEKREIDKRQVNCQGSKKELSKDWKTLSLKY